MLTVRTEPEFEWCRNFANVLSLAHWLNDGGAFPDVAACIYYFEKPWKWTDEWKESRTGRTMAEWEEAKERYAEKAEAESDDLTDEQIQCRSMNGGIPQDEGG